MEGSMETVSEAEEQRADSEAPRIATSGDLDDPWDLDETAPGASTVPGGRACNVVATVLLLLLSAGVIIGSVVLLILKTSPSPLEDQGPLSGAILLPETEEPQGSSEATRTRGSVSEGKTRRYDPWTDGRGGTAWARDEDGPRSFETNMSAVQYLRKYGNSGRPGDDMDDVF